MPLPVRRLKAGLSVDDALRRYNNRSNRLTKASVTPSGAAISGLGQVQPRLVLLWEYVSRRLKLRGQVQSERMSGLRRTTLSSNLEVLPAE
jgi:hypothetical protein